MNKTVNVNLGGYFFHIDENAYNKLDNYLKSIELSLKNEEGKKEIIDDIEFRISELLLKNRKDPLQVINESKIDKIIEIMGQPEDYQENESDIKKTNSDVKKLYRDSEDYFLGGVCSGLSYYFGMQVLWIRLIFVALFFLGIKINIPSIGLYMGLSQFAFLTYIALWILVPKASTTAEKLEMKGHEVTIDNIEKKIKEDINIQSIQENQNQSGFHKILDVIKDFFKIIFKSIGKFTGVLLLFISSMTIISLIIALFSFGNYEWININGVSMNYPPFFMTSSIPKWILALCLFLALLIPLLGLLRISLKILSSDLKPISLSIIIGLIVIWLVSILVLTNSGVIYLIENNKSLFIE